MLEWFNGTSARGFPFIHSILEGEKKGGIESGRARGQSGEIWSVSLSFPPWGKGFFPLEDYQSREMTMRVVVKLL